MIALKQAPEMLEPLTSGTRSNLADIVKGMAIILVVYGHTAQGLVHRKWWDTPGAAFAHSFIYSFHMAAFFFAAGLFVQRSIDHRGAKRFALEKMKGIPEGDGTLLDHCMVVYGSGNSDGNRHNHDDLPILLAGKAGKSIRTGRHVSYGRNTPLNNLWLSMLDRMGSGVESLGDSTGRLANLA